MTDILKRDLDLENHYVFAQSPEPPKILEFSMTVSQYGTFHVNRKEVYYEKYDYVWKCGINDFCDNRPEGFVKSFHDHIGVELPYETAFTIWQNIIMQYGFLTR